MAYWLLSLLYVGLACLILRIELRRNGTIVPDPLGIFILIVILQCVLPGVLTYGLLPLAEPGEATGAYIFDRIYTHADIESAYLVFALTGAFIYFVYVGTQTTRAMLESRFGKPHEVPQVNLQVSTHGLVATLILGFAFTIVAFLFMGSSFIERYANLILLRSIAMEIERTALTANALSLVQTWSWLSIIALFAIAEQRGRTLLWYLCLVMLVVFAFLGVSRRALFLPIVFAYLIVVMSDGRWRIGKLVALGVVLLPMVAFGKEILAVISYGGSPERVEQTYETLIAAGLRTSSDIGITVSESLGTLSMMEMPPRLGVDHAYSLMQRFPEGAVGLTIEFPERIVRISTARFADEWTVDIPPGLFGQMWLDFRVFGPIIWGLAFGLQIGILQYAWSRVKRRPQSAAVFFMLIFVVALPINTGSYDFTFSVDIIAVLFLLFLTVRLSQKESPVPLVESWPHGRS